MHYCRLHLLSPVISLVADVRQVIEKGGLWPKYEPQIQRMRQRARGLRSGLFFLGW